MRLLEAQKSREVPRRRRTRRYVGRARNIAKEVRRKLDGHQVEICQAELKRLGLLSESEQHDVVNQLISGAKTLAEAIILTLNPRSYYMVKIVIARQAQGDLEQAPGYDLYEKCDELKRLAKLPFDEQRVVAKKIKNGEADSVYVAIEQLAAEMVATQTS